MISKAEDLPHFVPKPQCKTFLEESIQSAFTAYLFLATTDGLTSNRIVCYFIAYILSTHHLQS